MADTPRYSEKDKKDLQTVILDAVKSSTYGDNIGKHIANSQFAKSATKNLDILAANIQQPQKDTEQSPQRQVLDSIVDKVNPLKPKPKKQDTENVDKETESKTENKTDESKEKNKGRQILDIVFGEINKTKGFTEFKENLKELTEKAAAPVRVAKGLINIFKKPKAEEPQKQDAKSEKGDTSTIPILKQSPAKTENKPSPTTEAAQPPANKPVENEQPKAEVKTAAVAAPKAIAAKAAEPPKVTTAERPTVKSSERPAAENKEEEQPKPKGRQVVDLLKNEIGKSEIGTKFKEAKEGITNHPVFRIAKGVAGIFSKPKEEKQESETTTTEIKKTAKTDNSITKQKDQSTKEPDSTAKPNAVKSSPTIDGTTALKEQKKETTALALSTKAQQQHGSAEKTLHSQKMAMIAEEAETKRKEMQDDEANQEKKMAMADERIKKKEEELGVEGKKNKGILGFLKAEALADAWKTAQNLKNSVIRLAQSAKELAIEKTRALGQIAIKIAHGAAGVVKSAFMLPFPINLAVLGASGAALVAAGIWAKRQLSGGGGAPSGGGGSVPTEQKEEKSPDTSKIKTDGIKQKEEKQEPKASSEQPSESEQPKPETKTSASKGQQMLGLIKKGIAKHPAVRLAKGFVGMFAKPKEEKQEPEASSEQTEPETKAPISKAIATKAAEQPMPKAEGQPQPTHSAEILPKNAEVKIDKNGDKKSNGAAFPVFALLSDLSARKKQMQRITELMEQISEKLDKIASVSGGAGEGNTYNYTETTVPPQPDENNGVSTSNVFDAIRYAMTRTR